MCPVHAAFPLWLWLLTTDWCSCCCFALDGCCGAEIVLRFQIDDLFLSTGVSVLLRPLLLGRLSNLPVTQ